MSRESRSHNIADDTSDGKKRRFKRPVRAYLIYTLVVLLLATAVTAARYVVSTEAADKARVITFGDIDIVEDEANGPVTKDGTLAILPGADITKKATVEFAGSESACYVFIKVTAPEAESSDKTSDKAWMWGGANNANHFGAMKSDDAYRIAWDVSDDWTYLTKDKDGDKEYYVYYRILDANKTMGDISNGADVDGTILKNNTISVASTIRRTELDNIGGFEISFEATAVQYDGWNGDAGKAWESLSGN